MYQGSKIILALLIFGYVCEVAALSTITSLIDADSQSTPLCFLPASIHANGCMRYLFGNIVTNEILMGLYICADMDAPSFYRPYVIWLPIVVCDGILCLLAVWYGVSVWMAGYRAKRSDGVRIADVLVRGGVGYFVWYACPLWL